MTTTDADDRAALLRRLAACGASATLQRDCAAAPLEQLRRLVASLESTPSRPTLADVWASDAEAFATAQRGGA